MTSENVPELKNLAIISLMPRYGDDIIRRYAGTESRGVGHDSRREIVRRAEKLRIARAKKNLTSRNRCGKTKLELEDCEPSCIGLQLAHAYKHRLNIFP